MDFGVDSAIENVMRLYKNDAYKDKISSRICKLAALLDPKFKIQKKTKSENSFFSGNDQKIPTENERKRVEMRLNGFDYKNSDAWQIICERFGPTLSQSELLSIAQVIAFHAKIKLDREAKRRKEVLIKWFQENIVEIMPFLNRLVLEDSEGNRIG